MKVAAVVVNWNGGDENFECLASLLAQGLAPEDLVFVDNGSTDGSFERVALLHPGMVFVRNSHNTGYGAATNQGVLSALARGYQAIFLVNNDVSLPPGTLAGLLEVLQRSPRNGIVGPRVLYKQDPSRVWAAGGELTFRENLTTLMGHGQPDSEHWRAEREVDYVIGCAMLVRREVFDQAGLLDAAYFAYHEDVDFCLKASEHGFRCISAGQQSALHTTGHSTGGGYNPRRKYMMGVNTIWFLRRHGSFSRWSRFLFFDVLSLPPLLLLGLARGQGRAVLAKAKGMWDGMLGRRITHEMLEPGSSLLW